MRIKINNILGNQSIKSKLFKYTAYEVDFYADYCFAGIKLETAHYSAYYWLTNPCYTDYIYFNFCLFYCFLYIVILQITWLYCTANCSIIYCSSQFWFIQNFYPSLFRQIATVLLINCSTGYYSYTLPLSRLHLHWLRFFKLRLHWLHLHWLHLHWLRFLKLRLHWLHLHWLHLYWLRFFKLRLRSH